MSSCSICGVGRYSPINGTIGSCTLCHTGTYNSDLATDRLKHDSIDDCTDCAGGTLSSVDRSFCAACTVGQYARNSSECVDCEIGRYAPSAQDGACLSCGAGFSTNLRIASTSCSTCDGGKAQHGVQRCGTRAAVHQVVLLA